MSKKDDLREQRAGTVINATSKRQERRLEVCLEKLHKTLTTKYGVKIEHESKWFLKDIVAKLREQYPEVNFGCVADRSSMKPDGGILSLVDKTERRFPILITELKNQGTNDVRAREGKAKQAKGNAIERLGKNVIGFRTALLNESIFPFVCFGDGCDFADDSSIVDRVTTIAMFGERNKVQLHNEGQFNRGSFYFRVPLWTAKEMLPIMAAIAERSILHYFSKYGEEAFK